MQRALRGVATNIDVFEQRRRDSLVVGRADLAKRALFYGKGQQVLRMAYAQEVGVLKLLWLGFRAGCLQRVFKILSRRMRGRI